MKHVIFAALLCGASVVQAQQTADAEQPEAATSGVFRSLDPVVQSALASKAAGQPVVAQN